jgi:putative SOS response-associated peptidase YedK
MRWGLVPSWWSKPLKELKLATFNARADTVTEKPFFRTKDEGQRSAVNCGESAASNAVEFARRIATSRA